MKYPFKVYQTQVEGHVFWIAECPCLKGCVGQGDTIDEAISSLEENEAVWIETASECGIEIPAVPVETINGYSGKFTVRISPAVHRAAVQYAQAESVSLNQYVNDAIVAQNTRYETIGYLATPIRDAISRLIKMPNTGIALGGKGLPLNENAWTDAIQVSYRKKSYPNEYSFSGSKEVPYASN